MNLAAATAAVQANLPADLDGFPIALILELLSAILPIIADKCTGKTATEAIAKGRMPVIVTMVVRNQVSKKIGTVKQLGIRRFNSAVIMVSEAIKKTAATAPAADIVSFVEAMNH